MDKPLKYPIAVAHTYNPNTWEAKEDSCLFKASLGYTVGPQFKTLSQNKSKLQNNNNKTKAKIQLLWQKRKKYKLSHISVSQRRPRFSVL